MKTSQIARGIVGALSLAGVMGAIGCGAGYDGEGAAGEGEIGETSQAIAVADIVATTALPEASAFGSSCVINTAANGSGTNYLVAIPGVTSAANTYSVNAYLRDGATWRGPFALPTGMTGGTSKAAMITRQNDKRECLLFGGEIGAAGATKVAQVAKLTFATVGGNPGLVTAQAGALNTARSRAQVVPCGDKSVAIMGGNNGITSIEVWNGELNSGAGPTAATALALLRNNANSANITLNVARTDFSAVPADTLHFAVASGQDGSGNRLGSLEAFTVVQDGTLGCKLSNAANAHYTLTPTITARFGLKGFQSAHAANDDTFRFVAGDKDVSGTPTASAAESVVKIDWTTPANSALVSQADNLATAVVSPALAFKPGASAFLAAKTFIAGGSDPAANPSGLADYQENDAATWTVQTTRTGGGALPLRVGATALYEPGTDRVIVFGGHNGALPTPSFTNSTSVDLITP